MVSFSEGDLGMAKAQAYSPSVLASRLPKLSLGFNDTRGKDYFYVSTCPGHKVSRYLAKHFSLCFRKGAFDEINVLISRLHKADGHSECR